MIHAIETYLITEQASESETSYFHSGLRPKLNLMTLAIIIARHHGSDIT
jgi:hypothetical protein